MELQRLQKTGANGVMYHPDDVIEGWTSLVWTERYVDAGEFELKTPMVTRTMDLLPEMSFVAVRDSDEVMMVETHSIKDNILTITGRTLDAFLENRIVRGVYQKKRRMNKEYTPAQAVAVLVWNAMCNDSGEDVTNVVGKGQPASISAPNIGVTIDPGVFSTDSRRRWIKTGPLYDQLLEFLRGNDLGIRMKRPFNADATPIDVATGGASRGDISNPGLPTGTNGHLLKFDVYEGLDLTGLVKFSHKVGDISNSESLFSVRPLKTRAYVDSSEDWVQVSRTGESGLSGFDAKYFYVDGGSPDDDQTKADFKDDLPDLGEAQLKLRANKRTKLYSGDISPDSEYVFKDDYNLGDLVKVIGEYGLTVNMVVSEYVRTHDATGEKGSPTLELPAE